MTLNTVYATDVPAAVLIFEPASVSIPAMLPGQSASGELTLTNYGLIRADHIKLAAPDKDEFFRFEFFGSLPESLAPKQRITIPYRVTALKPWFQTGAADETGGGCEWYKNCDTVVKWDFLCANGRMTQKELTLCFQSLQCSNDSSDDGSQGAEPPDEDFPGLGSDNGGLDNYQILHFRTRSGGGSGGSSNSDGSGDGTRPANNDPPAKELDIDEMLCYPKGPDSGPFDPQKWYPILRDGDVTVQQKDSQQGWWHSVGCEVNTVNGTFVEQEIDLAVKIPGGMLNIQRTYFKANYGSQQPDAPDDYTWLIGTAGSGQFKMQGYPGDNKLGFTWLGDETRGYLLTQITTVEGTTFSLPPDHFRLRVKYDRDSGEILEEHYEYAGDPVNRTYYEHIEQHGENYIGQGRTLTTTNDGDTWRMEDLSKNWRLYDGDGFLTSSGTANGLLEEMLYDADRKLTGFKDRSGKQVIWVEYNDQGWIAEIRDCEDPADPTARRVTYEYAGGRLWKMTDVLGLSVNYQYDEDDRMIAKNDAGAGQQITIGYKDNGWVDYVNDSRGVDREFEYSYDKFYDEWHATIIYSSGQVEEFWYDEDGNTSQMAVDGMVVKTITRSEDGRVETMTGDAGNVQKTYDEWGNLLEVLYANDTTVRYEYDYRFHKISRMIDQRGTEYTYQYDDNGNLEYAVEAKGTSVERVTHYEYYPGGVLQRVTISGGDAEPVSTGYAYDADMRNVVSITDPLERAVELLEHDAAGHVLSTRDILGQTWTSEYDARGRQTARTDPLLRRSSTLYDASNHVKTTTAFGLTTTYGYDDWDRPQSVTDAAGNATFTAYNDRSLPVRVKDRAGHTTAEFVYDATLGLLREAYDSAGNKTAYHYDLNPYTLEHSYAQPVSIEYPTSTTTLTYDIMQRVIEEEHASQDGEIRTTSVTYDAGGNVKTTTDAEGKTTVFEYDALNRLIKHSAPGAGATEYRYDARDNLVWYKDPNGQATTYEYDQLNRLKKVSKPLLRETTYDYAPDDTWMEVTLPAGQRVKTSYDGLGRAAKTEYYTADNTLERTVAFEYDDPHNRLHTVSDGQVTITYTYDALSRQTGEEWAITDGPTLFYRYTYTANGLKERLTASGGLALTYIYDDANRLREMQIPDQTPVTFDEFEVNSLTRMTLPGKNVTTFGYNGFRELTALTARDPGQHALLDHTFSYYPSGNLKTLTTGSTTRSYDYDDASRLLSVTAATPETYTYDLLGNRTSQHDIEGAWQYNELNELLGYADVSYEYDDNGNLTHIKRDDEVVWTYIYDAANRMIHAEDATGSITADYLYDPFGRRLRKEVDKNGIVTTTYFLYADEGLIGEFSESGTPLRVYGYLPGSSTPLFLKQDDTYYWYRTDRLGVPHTLMETNGHVVWSGTYDAFGNCEVGVETVESHLRLPGQYFDKETGLYYNLNRYYDPKIGRYLQPDPAGDGLNPYTYVGANPVNAIDPNGLCAARMATGVAEIGAGFGIFAKSGGFASIAAWMLVVNGADNFQAGWMSLLSGEERKSSILEAPIHTLIPNDTIADMVYMSTQLAIDYAGLRAEWALQAPRVSYSGNFEEFTDELAKRRGTLATRLESNAERVLGKLEAAAHPRAHFFSRHGAQTTLAQQQVRAMTGLTPDGFAGRAVSGARFLTHRAQLRAFTRAQTIFNQTGTQVFEFTMGEIIGEGFLRGGNTYATTSRVLAVFRQGKLLTLYPKL